MQLIVYPVECIWQSVVGQLVELCTVKKKTVLFITRSISAESVLSLITTCCACGITSQWSRGKLG